MQIPEMFTGESLRRLVHGAIAGIFLTLAVGFSWFGYGLGWKLGSSVESVATARAEAAVVAAYAPVCSRDFVRDATDANWAGFKTESTWNRDSYLMNNGYATLPGEKEPHRQIAGACAEALGKILESRVSK
jgi:hypothetical protein